jgi:glycosylphosphatidylinositol transamidase
MNPSERQNDPDGSVNDNDGSGADPAAANVADDNEPAQRPADAVVNPQGSAVTPPPTQQESPGVRARLLGLRKKGVLKLLLCLPYLVGLLWHGLHPFVSVFTGETSPRRVYTDENSAEPTYFRISHSKFKRREHLLAPKYRDQPLSSLCRAVRAVTLHDSFALDRGNLQCQSIRQALDILQFTPSEGPVLGRTEAIVFVLPASNNWMESHLHVALLSFLVELAQPHFNWLSKTFYVVAPRIREGIVLNVSQAVNVFLEAYLGPSRDTEQTVQSLVGGPPVALPTGMNATSLIRQVVVWDQLVVEKETVALKLPTLRILPHGPRGLLPNMDLVSIARVALQRAVSSNAYYAIHPFQDRQGKLIESLDSICHMLVGTQCPPRETSALLNMLFFEHALRGHDLTAPHAVALERGIDSLTIQLVTRPFTTTDTRMRNASSKLPGAMEVCLRALSNLHERLHHSTSLYLLLSMDHFVKHEEYLVPNLLLLIPLIIRAVTLFLVDLDEFDWEAVGQVVERTLLSTVCVAWGLELIDFVESHSWWILADSLMAQHAVLGLVYLFLGRQFLFVDVQRPARSRGSMQFVACLWCLYTHLAIAFGHVSLAFPSALFWTPLIAFPHFSKASESPVDSAMGGRGPSRIWGPLVFVGLAPFVWLVPSVLPFYTPYVRYAYVPLHLMTSHVLF